MFFIFINNIIIIIITRKKDIQTAAKLNIAGFNLNNDNKDSSSSSCQIVCDPLATSACNNLDISTKKSLFGL